MTQPRAEKWIAYITFLYVAVFSLNSLLSGNLEFVYYEAVIVLSILIVLLINRRIHFYPAMLLSLSLLGLFHLLGGNVWIGDTRLYDVTVLYDMFRYDNFVHMFGSGIMVMLAYTLLQPVLHKDFEKHRQGYFLILLVIVGMGLASVNEIIEFGAVLMFNVGKWVGDYTNTLVDLIYNTIGSLIAAYLLIRTNAHLSLRADR